MVINSASNQNVQFVKRLAQRKYRKLHNLFIAEGANIIKDLPLGAKLHSLYIAESKRDIFAEYADTFSCPTYVLSDRVFNSISDTVNPSGILAVLPCSFNDLNKIGKKALILDKIADSGNLGTIIRTAAAFGYIDVVLVNSADPYSGKAVRSSMGGIFRVKLYETDYEDICTLDHEIYILDMKGADIQDAELPDKHLLVVGSEAHGVSDYFRGKAKLSLSIEMQGDIESLNAAVSAGIAMYTLSRNRSLTLYKKV